VAAGLLNLNSEVEESSSCFRRRRRALGAILATIGAMADRPSSSSRNPVFHLSDRRNKIVARLSSSSIRTPGRRIEAEDENDSQSSESGLRQRSSARQLAILESKDFTGWKGLLGSAPGYREPRTVNCEPRTVIRPPTPSDIVLPSRLRLAPVDCSLVSRKPEPVSPSLVNCQTNPTR
jgi:hypothetical protein